MRRKLVMTVSAKSLKSNYMKQDYMHKEGQGEAFAFSRNPNGIFKVPMKSANKNKTIKVSRRNDLFIFSLVF